MLIFLQMLVFLPVLWILINSRSGWGMTMTIPAISSISGLVNV